MSRYDQRNQIVTTQYNAVRDIIFDPEGKLRGPKGCLIRTSLLLLYLVTFAFSVLLSYPCIHSLAYKTILDIVINAQQVTFIQSLLDVVVSIVSIETLVSLFLVTLAVLVGLFAVLAVTLVVNAFLWVIRVEA